jgi:fibronectin type 3 domain-containing protein
LFLVVVSGAALLARALPVAFAANGTITFVQVNSSTPRGAPTSVAATYLTTQTAGSLNVVVVGWGDATQSVVSVTDSSNNVYTLAVPVTRMASAGLSQTIYYARNIAAAAAGTNTVTVTFDGPTNYPDVRILEYNGADLVSPVDVTSAGTGVGATSATPDVTTTYANDLLFAASTVATVSTGPGAGFTQRIITGDGNIAEDQMVSAVGSYSATASLNSAEWIAQLVAFRAAPPSGPDTTPPTAPAGLTATAVNGTRIDLSWSASTDDTGVTGYRVERCQDTGCSTFAQILTPTTTSVSDTTVVNTTSYSYRVLALDAAGNTSGYSNIASATTPDTVPPAAPSGLAATAVNGTRIDLSWSASTDNVGVTGYRVERCQGTGCSTFAQVLTPTTTSVSDTTVVNATSYSYRVLAVDAAGNTSGYSNVAGATTPDTAAPTAPGGLTATVVNTTRIDLSWTASTDNVGVTGYRVERCEGTGCATFGQILTPTTTSVSDTTVVNGTSYSYRVPCDRRGGQHERVLERRQRGDRGHDGADRARRTGGHRRERDADRSGLEPSTDNIGVTGYRVERCQGAGCSTFAQILTPTTTSVSDTSVTAGNSYSYRVLAVDAAGNTSGYSNVASAATPAGDTTPPTAPGTPTATVVSSTQINLSWAASTDAVGVTGYMVERCQGASCSTFAQVAAAPGRPSTTPG